MTFLVAGAALGLGLETGAPALAQMPHMSAPVTEGLPASGSNAVLRRFEMTDSVAVYGSQYLMPSRGTIIVLHGLGGHDTIALQAGDSLRRATQMNVLFLDLRGHGRSGGAPGHVARDKQYADDLTTVIRALKRATPSGPVLLVGVREGAGTVLAVAARALDAGQPKVQGIALVDPMLSVDSLIADAAAGAAPLIWHTRRLRTQQSLNRVGVHIADRLPVAYQQSGSSDGGMVRAFSWRAIRALFAGDAWDIANNARLPVLLISHTSLSAVALRRTDEHEVVVVPATSPRWSTATYRAMERWTAQFSADAAPPRPVLPFVSVPFRDTTP